ncbi:Cytochrome P450 84A1 [Linum grandiflorum]
MGTLVLLFVFLVMIIILFLRHGRSSRLPLPPGPRGLPIIGNMLMMDQLTHHGLAKLAKQYGGLFHLRMGNIHMMTVSTSDIAKQVLKVHDNIFSNRPANIAINYLTYDRSDMAFAHYGPFWRQMRKITVMKLFSRRRAESWDSVRDEISYMVQTVAANPTGNPINVGELIFTFTMNLTYKAAFGTTSNNNNNQMQAFIKILQEFSRLFGTFNIADFIPFLSWMDPQGLFPRMVNARSSLDNFIDQIMNDHLRTQHDVDHLPDMVDELLAFYTPHDRPTTFVDDATTAPIKLTKDNIKAIIMDVMFGGTETVASVIEWAMAELLKSPQDLKRVQQELTYVVGLNRHVEEKDLEKLTFLKCILKETLRLHPPIPLLLHETAEDVEVSGYFIPKRSRVMVNAFAIGRDPNSWSNPNEFNPSRFLNQGMPDFKGSNFEFLPFGSGRRSCPGMQLGLYAIELGMAHLLHDFNWELPYGMKPNEVDMTDVFGLTAPRATRLIAVPTSRLTC